MNVLRRAGLVLSSFATSFFVAGAIYLTGFLGGVLMWLGRLLRYPALLRVTRDPAGAPVQDRALAR